MIKIVNLLALTVMLAVLVAKLNATEYPAPPEMPDTFNNPEDVRKYLSMLQKYYTIVGKLDRLNFLRLI